MNMEVKCWQQFGGWVFYTKNSQQLAAMKQLCRQVLGRSHGSNSAWHIQHSKLPNQPSLHNRQTLVVKDLDLATQLKLTCM